MFFLKLSLNKLANNLFELKASDPHLKIEQFPDFKHKAATSAVTFGLLSYIIPITPIGIDIFAMWRVYLTVVGFTFLYNSKQNDTLRVLAALWIASLLIFSAIGAFFAGLAG